MEAQQFRPIRYKLVCEQNVFCYRDVRSYVKANYPKSLPFALKVLKHSKFIEWCSLCSAVCWCRLHLCCLRRWISSRRSRSRGFFGVKSSPARIDNSAFLCLLFCLHEKWLVNIVLQTTKRQLFMNTCTLVIDGNSKSLSVQCCLETKMRRDVKLLSDVMADTIGYIQVKMRAATLQLARTHTRFTRFALNEIINSLRSALCASLRGELKLVGMVRNAY